MLDSNSQNRTLDCETAIVANILKSLKEGLEPNKEGYRDLSKEEAYFLAQFTNQIMSRPVVQTRENGLIHTVEIMESKRDLVSHYVTKAHLTVNP